MSTVFCQNFLTSKLTLSYNQACTQSRSAEVWPVAQWHGPMGVPRRPCKQKSATIQSNSTSNFSKIDRSGARLPSHVDSTSEAGCVQQSSAWGKRLTARERGYGHTQTQHRAFRAANEWSQTKLSLEIMPAREQQHMVVSTKEEVLLVTSRRAHSVW
jgi:hypothetical protein